MKLKYEMAVINTDDALLATAVESDVPFNGVIRINESTAEIFEMLKNEITEDEIVEKLFKKYEADKTTIKNNVARVIEALMQNDLLEL